MVNGAKYSYDRTLRWMVRRVLRTQRQAAAITVHDSGSSSEEGTYETSSPENIWSDVSISPTPSAIDEVLRWGTLRRARASEAGQQQDESGVQEKAGEARAAHRARSAASNAAPTPTCAE